MHLKVLLRKTTKLFVRLLPALAQWLIEAAIHHGSEKGCLASPLFSRLGWKYSQTQHSPQLGTTKYGGGDEPQVWTLDTQ